MRGYGSIVNTELSAHLEISWRRNLFQMPSKIQLQIRSYLVFSIFYIFFLWENLRILTHCRQLVDLIKLVNNTQIITEHRTQTALMGQTVNYKSNSRQDIGTRHTGWIRIQCRAIVGLVWMTTKCITCFDLPSWFASESWPDQTRLLCLIHTKFIIILSWYQAHCSSTLNSDSLSLYSNKCLSVDGNEVIT